MGIVTCAQPCKLAVCVPMVTRGCLQCFSAIKIHSLAFPWLRSCYLTSVKLVREGRLREKVLLQQTAVKHVRQ